MPVDYSKYSPDWKLRSRFIRHYRARNKCERCGAPNGQWILRGEWQGGPAWQNDDGQIYCAETGRYMGDNYVGEICTSEKTKAIRVVLTVAHLDHNVKNNSFFNLAALCQRCHLRHDAALHAQNAKATRLRKSGQQQLTFDA